MFEKLKYTRATKGFFNPDLEISVDRNSFMQIIQGKVINPRRLENPKTNVDYGYFLVSVPYRCSLNSWAGQKWGPNNFEIAEERSNFYGLLSCEGESSIIIPSKKEIIRFNPKSSTNLGKFGFSSYVTPLYRTGGSYQADKVGQKILLTSLSIQDLGDCFKEVFYF